MLPLRRRAAVCGSGIFELWLTSATAYPGARRAQGRLVPGRLKRALDSMTSLVTA
jgi:hypothetical protein